jgi:hypothetical protein
MKAKNKVKMEKCKDIVASLFDISEYKHLVPPRFPCKKGKLLQLYLLRLLRKLSFTILLMVSR